MMFTFPCCMLLFFFIALEIGATEKVGAVMIERQKMHPPFNVDYLGRSYNIFLANPMGKTVDEGFSNAIFDISITPLNNPVEWGYLAPEGMYVSATESCQLSSTSEIIETSKQYFNSLSQFVSVSAEGSYGAHSGSFSASVDYNKVTSGTNSGTKKYVLSTAMCEVFRCNILSYNAPKLVDTFVHALETLKEERKEENKKQKAYNKFFKHYGTHVAHSLVMGSRISIRSEFSTSAFKKMKSEGLNIQAAASYSYEGVVASGSVSAESKTDKKSKSKETFNNARSSVEIFSIGALPPSDGNTQTWASSAKENPVPIKYTLVPIWDYFWHSKKTKVFLIQDENMRNEMKKAAQTYSIELLKNLDLAESKKDTQQKICEFPNQIYKKNRCIKVSQPKESWYVAQEECVKFGGSLVEIDSDEKQRFLRGITTSESWIGLNDLENEGQYVWINKAFPVFTNWASGEPNNHGGKEDCVLIRGSSGKWNDEGCEESRNFICERIYSAPKVKTKEKSLPKSCDDGDNFYDSSETQSYCIKFENTKLTWSEARQKCQNWGGDLVTIKNEEKSKFLFNEISKQDYWIGLSDAAREGQWLWIDQKGLRFHKWQPGEPNNSGNEDCVNVRKGSMNWNDENCNDKKVFICEKKIQTTKSSKSSSKKTTSTTSKKSTEKKEKVDKNQRPVKSTYYRMIRRDKECKGKEEFMGKYDTVNGCAKACIDQPGCTYFTYGKKSRDQKCYWKRTTYSCKEGFKDSKNYDYFQIQENKRKIPIGSYKGYYEMFKFNHVCKTSDVYLGKFNSIGECANACNNRIGCMFFIYGKKGALKKCYMERTTANCKEGFSKNTEFDFYGLSDYLRNQKQLKAKEAKSKVKVKHIFFGKYRSDVECRSGDTYLGKFDTAQECADKCAKTKGCLYFIYGKRGKAKRCFHEKTRSSSCQEGGFKKADYDFYRVYLGTWR